MTPFLRRISLALSLRFCVFAAACTAATIVVIREVADVAEGSRSAGSAAIAAGVPIAALALLVVLLVREIGRREAAESAAKAAADAAAQDSRQVEARLQSILDHVPVAISLKDREHRYVVLNRQYEKWFGVTEQQQLGRSLRDVGTDEAFSALMEGMEDQVLATGAVHASEVEEPDIGTAPQWVLTSKFPVRDREGGIIGVGTVNIDVSERHAAEKALRTSEERARVLAQEAERASRAKSEFLVTMSHEIRTPLNGVLGMSELLLETALDDRQRGYAQMLRDAATSLLALINDILDISRLEAGRVEIEDVEFELQEIVDAAVALVLPGARDRGLELRAGVDPDLRGRWRGDPLRLRQVVLNLLANAVKFTETGSVSLAVAGTGRMVRFEVSDTGPGIADDVLPRLFRKFEQGDSSITRRFGGSGLGLAICRQIVTLMGGEIGATSSPGKGSTFWFEVPLVRSAAGASSSGERSADLSAPGAVPSLRVLVAEDNRVNQVFFADLLRNAGHHVDVVENGRLAVEAARSRAYDLILMDVQMPEMGGVEATRLIRNLPGPPSGVTIIALTANAMTGAREEYAAAGMDDYLSKPVSSATLLGALGRVAHRLGKTAAAVSDPTTPSSQSESEGAEDTTAATLDSLEAVMSLDAIREIAALYLEQAEDCVGHLARVGEDGDLNALAFDVHKIAGCAGNIGAERVSALARILEAACRRGDRDATRRLGFELGRAIDQSSALIRRWCERPREVVAGGRQPAHVPSDRALL